MTTALLFQGDPGRPGRSGPPGPPGEKGSPVGSHSTCVSSVLLGTALCGMEQQQQQQLLVVVHLWP